jgi:RNA polymerase sigma factor (sigma-70 family)
MRTMLRGHSSGALIHQLERLFHQGTTVGLTEGELLERFARGHDEAAFEALIARHGPMVLGVCRQLLRDPNDVDDAFQATFLVLVRKAGTLRRCDLLGNWLYGVAYRVANRARVMAARRTARAPHGQEAFDRLDADGRGPAAVRIGTSDLSPEPRPWLHEEVGRLPEKYRVVVRLCYLEGLTHEEAALRLGCPIGTVKGRLSRARDLLRKRLTRRGLTLSAAALASHLALADARAAVPASLVYATLEAAKVIASTAAISIVTTSAVSLPVAALTEGVLQAMIMTKAKSIALTLMMVGAATTGVVIGATRLTPRETETDPPSQATSTPDEPKTSPEGQQARLKKVAAAKDSPSSGPTRKAGGSASRDSAEAGGAGPGGRTGRQMLGGMGGGMGMIDGAFAGVESTEEATELRRRLEIAQLSAALPTWEKNPKNEAILKKLEEPIAMSFATETPLEDVLKYIKSAMAKQGGAPIPIYVDPVGLKQLERTSSSTISIDLEGAPLKTSLRLILKQLGLAYCVRDGVLIISSPQVVRAELAEAAREIIGAGNNGDKVNMRLMVPMNIGPLGDPQ